MRRAEGPESKNSGPSTSCPYSPKRVEAEFSEVGGSKQPIRRSGKSSITTWWHPFSVKTLRFGSSSCTVLYQGVVTRNGATTGEIRAMSAMLAVLSAGTAAAHPHFVSNANHDQLIANGQNHPGFVTDSETGLITMCEGVNEPADSGPAGYGLETAHHGPDAGTAGKGDGCYAVEDDAPPPPDTNPAID